MGRRLRRVVTLAAGAALAMAAARYGLLHLLLAVASLVALVASGMSGRFARRALDHRRLPVVAAVARPTTDTAGIRPACGHPRCTGRTAFAGGPRAPLPLSRASPATDETA